MEKAVTDSLALFEAVQDGDLTKLASCLDASPGLVNARSEKGFTLLAFASYMRKPEVVRFLLSRGAEVDLFNATILGDEERTRALLHGDSKRANSHSPDGWSPLHLAAHFGHLHLVRLLHGIGADVDGKSLNALANTPLHAAVAGRSKEVRSSCC
jgi:uncharacterized protein